MNKKLALVSILALLTLAVACDKSEGVNIDTSPEESVVVSTVKDIPDKPTISDVTPSRANDVVMAQKKYPDTVGWLTVNGTDIDNFVVQNPVWNNNHYLTNDLDGNPDKNGTYCVDYSCNFPSDKGEGLSFITPIYAHNHDDNPNGILFAQLKKYQDPEFAKNNPYLFFSTVEKDMAFEIFAVFDTTVALPYIYTDWHWNAYSQMFEIIYSSSIYNYGIKVSENDKILVLSTCTFSVPNHENLSITTPNDYRFVVMAKLVEPDSELKTAVNFTQNNSVLIPDDQPKEEYWDDLITVNNTLYFRIRYPDLSWSDDFYDPSVQKIGEIKRTGITENMQDFDATFLASGTILKQAPLYPGVVFAQNGNEHSIYYKEESAIVYTQISVLDSNQEPTKEPQFINEENTEIFDPYLDMIYANTLKDSFEDLEKLATEASAIICVEYQYDNYDNFEYRYFLATPPSLGYEVMVIMFPWEEAYYMPAEKYHSFLKLVSDI